MVSSTRFPAAFIDHKASPPLARHRVFSGDLDFVVANWKKKDGDLPGDCVDRGCGGRWQFNGAERRDYVFGRGKSREFSDKVMKM